MTAHLALLAAALAAAPAAEGPRSVYRVDAWRDGAVVGVALAGVAIPNLLSDRIIDPRCPCDASDVNGFDRGALGNDSARAADLSNLSVAALIAVPLAADAVALGWNRALLEDVVVFGETLLVNAAIAELPKNLVQRPIPRTYDGDPAFLDSRRGYRSFWSGHTSAAFAGMSAVAYTIRLRYGERVWPWLVAAGFGASVGVERVLAGRHFPSDVLAAAVAGTAVGIAVPWLHAREAPVALAPAAAGRGLALRVAF